jgi:hypothetical protein
MLVDFQCCQCQRRFMRTASVCDLLVDTWQAQHQRLESGFGYCSVNQHTGLTEAKRSVVGCLHPPHPTCISTTREVVKLRRRTFCQSRYCWCSVRTSSSTSERPSLCKSQQVFCIHLRYVIDRHRPVCLPVLVPSTEPHG